MILVTLLLSTSTTAYLGLMVLIPLLFLCVYRLGLLRLSHLAIGAFAICAISVIFLASPTVKDLFGTEIAGKLSTGSGQERAGSIAIAAKYFYQYPVLGVGWGSVTSHDLIVKLLSNTGILGFGSFAVLIATCLNRLRQHVYQQLRRSSNHQEIADSVACLLALGLLIILNCVTEFAYVFGHFWFILALSIGISMQRLCPPYPPRASMTDVQVSGRKSAGLILS